jgi:TRAP-type uncharacterized transport system substrate-binding protein
VAGLLVLTLPSTVWSAEKAQPPEKLPRFTLEAGGPDSQTLRMAADIQNIIEGETDYRVVPMTGRGPVESLFNVVERDGIDAGILPADVLTYAKRHDLVAKLDDKIAAVAKLGTEDVHIIAGPGIGSIEELRGKRVNIGTASDGRFVTGNLVFDLLGIAIEPTSDDLATALSEIASGKTQAAVVVARKPSSAVAALPEGQFTLLSIPLNDELRKTYAPSVVMAKDYPNLIADGGAVYSLANSIVLAVGEGGKGSARDKRVKAFTKALYDNVASLYQGQRFADWSETNLAAEIAGWDRSDAAEAWLEAQAQAALETQSNEEEALKVAYKAFKTRNASRQDAGLLIEDFVKWTEEQKP